MRGVKAFIPPALKYFLWFVFKSPQRQTGWYSLWLDTGGYANLAWYRLFKKRRPISICVGIYNRSQLFLNTFIPSLNACNDLSLIELSVFDCGSTDIADLEVAIRKVYRGRLVFSKETLAFSRALAFNRAVAQSNYTKIFICDADFSLPVNLVELCNRYTNGNCAWFPIVFYLYKNKPPVFDKQNGEWMLWGGKGLVACNKDDYNKAGRLNEAYTTWGYEDEELWLRFYRQGIYVLRTRCSGLLHHWHPSLNPKYKRLAELADRGML